MSDRPRVLILSFSPIASDARVLKQVRLFADRYDVTTCGFGPQPHPGVEHVQVARIERHYQSSGGRSKRVQSVASIASNWTRSPGAR